jgi:hypothetical protein
MDGLLCSFEHLLEVILRLPTLNRLLLNQIGQSLQAVGDCLDGEPIGSGDGFPKIV